MAGSNPFRWTQMWSPPRRFEDEALEQKFLAAYCAQFAEHRRAAIVFGIIVSAAYLFWDMYNVRVDSGYRAVFDRVVWNRIGTVLELVAMLGLALTARFSRSERYATRVLFAGCLANFAFYGYAFLEVPYPYDYMYFFVAMFINMIFGFAMLRLRARPAMWLMGSSLALAVVFFLWNGQVKQAMLDTPAARIYQVAALLFLFNIATIGSVVANLLEHTLRTGFLRTEELATLNVRLVNHSERVTQLNGDLQTALARIREESSARERVLATASHDLRQPLHALSVYSAILVANPDPSSAALRELSANIDQIARSLGGLLNGLLDLSQLSVGHYVAANRQFALDELLSRLCQEFQAGAAARGLTLHCEVLPLKIFSDLTGVTRIARNLLDNAIKYSERGAVTLKLTADIGFATITVTDTGKGIAPTEHARIFEEFYQVDNHGRDRNKGSGLGLAIVQRLVDLMDGSVTVQSELGKGSAFTVRLPLLQAPKGAMALAPAGGSAPAQPALVGLRIFVLDDEHDILRSMSMLLTSWHCHVDTAIDASALRELFAQFGVPDLLIADVRLRDSDSGLTVAQGMLLAHGNFPVIFLTGETASAALKDVHRGGWTVLHKPIDVDLLSQSIRAATVHPGPARRRDA